MEPSHSARKLQAIVLIILLRIILSQCIKLTIDLQCQYIFPISWDQLNACANLECAGRFCASVQTTTILQPALQSCQQFTGSSLPSNEELDERSKFFVGGSIDRTASPNRNWYGYIHQPIFYANFFIEKEIYQVILDDAREVSYFNINQQYADPIQDSNGKYNKLTFGSTVAQEGNDPQFSVNDGLIFSQSTNTFMKLSLTSQLDKNTFLSFWFKITNIFAGTYPTIFQILNKNNQQLFGLIIDMNLMQIKASYLGSSAVGSAGSSTVVLQKWHHLYVSISFLRIIQNSGQLLVTLAIDGQLSYQNQPFFSGSIPSTFETTEVLFGSSAGSTSFTGNIMDLFIGGGSFINLSHLLDQCILSIGIANPKCLFCGASYYAFNGLCVSQCPEGSYQDINSRICRVCHISCLTCSGPSMSSCLTCQNDFPEFFDGYCLRNCPQQTTLMVITGQESATAAQKRHCLCHSSCSECHYNAASSKAVCTLCSQNLNSFILGGICVEPLLCPFGQMGNPITSSCSSTCSPGKFINEPDRLCQDYCTIGTIQYIIPPGTVKKCVLVCPSGFYSTQISPLPANQAPDQTEQQCTQCSLPCITCSSSSFCKSCQAGYFLNEFNGVCSTPNCLTGYILDGNVICRACQVNCTSCPTGFYLFPQAQSCVEKCPIGFLPNIALQECQGQAIPIVTILNKTQSSQLTLYKVGRRQDLILQGSYIYGDQIKQLQWSIMDSTSDVLSSFFDSTVNNFTQLIIPFSNLLSNTIYNVTLNVTAQNGGSGMDYILIQTSQEIDEGLLDITPISGVAGVTVFNISFFLWTASEGTIQFDLTFSRQIIYTFRGIQHSVKLDLNPIQLQVQQNGWLTYTFPSSKVDQNITVELMAYTNKEVKVKSQKITLYQTPVATEDQQRVELVNEVWWIKLQGDLSIDEYLKKTNTMVFLYQESQLNELHRRHDELLMRSWQLLHFLPNQCNDTVQCRGSGVCRENFYDDSYFECQCMYSKKGDFCYWEERDFQILNNITYTTLQNIQSKPLSSADEVFKLAKVIANVVQVEDGLNKNSFRLIKNLIGKALAFNSNRVELYQVLLEIIGNILYQTVRRPSLRQDEKLKFTVQFKDLFRSCVNQMMTLSLQLNQQILMKNKYFMLFITKQFRGQISQNSINVDGYIIVPLDRSVVYIPQSIFSFDEPRTLHITQWNFDINYPQNELISPIVDIEVTKQDGSAILVQNLMEGQWVNIYFQKNAAYPPIRDDLMTHYYCEYLHFFDEENFEWKKDGTCKLSFENEEFIMCSCNHLTQFSVAKGLLEYIAELPERRTIQFYSLKNLYDSIQFSSLDTVNLDKQVQISKEPFIEPHYPISIQNFNWDQPTLIIYAIGVTVYLFFTVINQIRLRTGKVMAYDYRKRDLLLLTYHPLISMVMFGQTKISHTYQMRMTKFFSVVLQICAFVSVGYKQLELVNPQIETGSRIAGSAFFGIIMASAFNYVLEAAYYLIKRHVLKDRRNGFVYSIWFFFFMIITGIFGVFTNGYTRMSDYSSMVITYIIALLIDFFGLDILVLIYAFIAIDSPFLQFLAFRGFYIECILDKSSIKSQDNKEEAALIGSDQQQHMIVENLDIPEKQVGNNLKNNSANNNNDQPNQSKNDNEDVILISGKRQSDIKQLQPINNNQDNLILENADPNNNNNNFTP